MTDYKAVKQHINQLLYNYFFLDYYDC